MVQIVGSRGWHLDSVHPQLVLHFLCSILIHHAGISNLLPEMADGDVPIALLHGGGLTKIDVGGDAAKFSPTLPKASLPIQKLHDGR